MQRAFPLLSVVEDRSSQLLSSRHYFIHEGSQNQLCLQHEEGFNWNFAHALLKTSPVGAAQLFIPSQQIKDFSNWANFQLE
jgi:hypothetical protein